jgi:predicted permease
VSLDAWAKDFKHAARSLSRAPLFTVVIVVTLVLAIGANTAIFSVVKAVLLEPLPFPNADRLVHIGGTAPGTEQRAEFGVPDELYVEYRDNVPALEDIGFYTTGSSTTRAEGQAEQLFLTGLTPSVFTTLGARPMLGRLPTGEDDRDVVVLSHWLWESWFGSDAAVVGRSYFFGRQTRRVIGVMGPEFRFPDERVAFWWPIQMGTAQVTSDDFYLKVVARVAPGVERAELSAQLDPLARRVQERLGGPAPYARIMERHRPVVRPLREQLVGNVGTALSILLGMVGIVLLIACANVANLFAVRAESRRRDLAVRSALGSGRGGLVRSQMAEALLLALAGGAGGALAAWAGVPLLIRAAPEAVAGGFDGAPIPGLATAGVDTTALLFAAAVSVLAACAFGLLPAIRFSAVGLVAGLREARVVAGRHGFTRDTLVVVQIASALVLLVGSALLVRSFWQLSRVDPGYDTTGIFTFRIAPERVAPGRDELDNRAAISQFQYAFMDRLAALPGVESVGFATSLPLDLGAGEGFVTTRRLAASGTVALRVRTASAGGTYFPTMGIGLVRGRLFGRVEEQQGAANVIISRSAADLLFPGEEPIDQQLRSADAPSPDTELEGETWYTVVGVVEDVLWDDLRQNPEPTVYLPSAALSPAYVLKSARANELGPEVRAIIRELIPESPMYRVFTMERLAANSKAILSFTMLMVVTASALALLLCVVGIYGVLSYVVTQRTREIAVRMALGAEPRGLRRMLVLQGGRVALIGVAVGVLIAFAVTRFLESLLFGVQAIDASTYIGMSSVMLAVALLASYVPARRASAVDPMQSLRAE